MTWLTSLPAAVLVVGGLALALLVAIGGRSAVRALVPAAERDAAYTIAARSCLARSAVRTVHGPYPGQRGPLLGVGARDREQRGRRRIPPGMGGDQPRSRLGADQSALLGYLRATRAYEWHGNSAAEGDDPATAHAIASLENAVRTQAARLALGTPASTELLASLDALTNDRRARLAAASHQLPVLYVAVLVLSGAALIVNATTLTLRSGWRSALLVGGLSAVIGLSLALLFALGTPWRGPITVSGHPIDTVVRDLNTGYFQR